MSLLRSETRKARKRHNCDAWEHYCNSSYGDNEFTPDELEVIKGVQSDGGQILPGMQYVYQSSVDADGFCEFRARPDMHAICLKYNLYPDW